VAVWLAAPPQAAHSVKNASVVARVTPARVVRDRRMGISLLPSRGLFHSANPHITASHAPNIIPKFLSPNVGVSGGCGMPTALPVVVTLTVAVSGSIPLSVTDGGVMAQVDMGGNPLQVNATVPFKLGAGAIFKL